MACACIKSGRTEKCAWCKEAIQLGCPPSQHSCQWYGGCS